MKATAETLNTVRSELAHFHKLNTSAGRPRYLFRGQNLLHDALSPSIARLTDSDARAQAYNVCRQGPLLGRAIEGYVIPRVEDGLALLQHYGWPTPLLDFTGTPLVAEFFAQLGWKKEHDAVVFVINCDRLPAEMMVVEHDFFVLPPSQGGLQHRWVRQDGFAVTVNDWRNMEAVLAFDLQAAPFDMCIEKAMRFKFPPDYVPHKLDLLSEHHDPVPRRIQEILRLCIQHSQFTLHQSLKAKLDGIFQGVPQVPHLSFDDLPQFIQGLPRWHKVGLAVILGQELLRWFTAPAGGDDSLKQDLNKALSYGEAACKCACSQPSGFQFTVVTAAHKVEETLKGNNDLRWLIARSIACAVGIAQVYAWDTSADCGLDVCMKCGVEAIQMATATGTMVAEDRERIESRLVSAARKLHEHAYSNRWSDSPVDLATI